MMNIDFPFAFNTAGNTATTPYPEHVRDLIEQVLFTNPGERVNRPTFGSGLLHLVFSPNSVELAGTTQYLVQASLQEWLGNVIEVRAVEVEAQGEKLLVTVRYLIRELQQEITDQFSRRL